MRYDAYATVESERRHFPRRETLETLLPFQIQRKQFPLQPGFATRMNKAQGHSLKIFGYISINQSSCMECSMSPCQGPEIVGQFSSTLLTLAAEMLSSKKYFNNVSTAGVTSCDKPQEIMITAKRGNSALNYLEQMYTCTQLMLPPLSGNFGGIRLLTEDNDDEKK
ncbi:hypothetical protein ElyMa_007011100 [Elysia marginata]|uniref:Uncharacterized protein n=1 Tax=Elysia marginata TaxID=1093978 RepID=A0AAV4JPP5_9GAST|nr:hypothetical protein ElyMa_007011100 [Elysia marginata]